MTEITGRLNGNISGLVKFTPDHSFIDTSTTPDTLVVAPIKATITNSSFTLTVPQSENISGQSVTYNIELFQSLEKIEFYKLNGDEYTGTTHQHTDSLYYTGSAHTEDSIRIDRVTSEELLLLQEPFHAVVPNTSDVDFTTLQGIPQLEPWLDIGVARLAELLTTDPLYRDRISSKLVVKGDYDNAVTYELGNVIAYNGNGYVYINAASSAGNAPPLTGNNAYWLMIAEKGEPGGTGAQLIGYNSAVWDGSAEAAARGDVKLAIESIPNPDLSNYLTVAAGLPRDNPVMTGSAKRSILSYPLTPSEAATEVATGQYVEDAIAGASLAAIPKPLIWTRKSGNQTVCNSGSASGDVRVVWDTAQLGSGNINNGVITIPATGNYLIGVCLHLRAKANNAYEATKMFYRAYLRNNSIDIEGLFRRDVRSTYTTYQDYQAFGLSYQHGLTQGDLLEVRANIAYSNNASALGDSQIIGSAVQNYLMLWEVSA